PLLANKPRSGRITAEKNNEKLGTTEWMLSNGARVVLKPTDFKNDQILFSATSAGGSSLADDRDYLSAQMAANIIDNGGVADFDETTLTKMLAGKKVSLSPTISQLQQGFNGNCAPKDAETMFQLVYLYAISPRKDPEAFKAFRSQMETFLKNRSADPNSAFRDTLQVTMAQYSPREKPFTMESLDQIDLDRSFTFYKKRFSDFGGFTFYLVGNLDIPKMREYCETYLASLPTAGHKESWKDLGINPPKGMITKSVYKGIEAKSNVAINITGPFVWNVKNRMELQAMTEVLAIKLRETLREDMGGVYGVRVNSSPIHYPHERYELSIGFGCDPARVNDLIGATKRKLDTMTMKPPEEIYMTKIKQTELHELEVNMKENNFWLRALSQYYWNGEDPNLLLDRKEMISGLSAEDIHRAAQKYCSKENMVEVVLYPEKN
ncbi:MAG: insulinase family protein, partial [Ignavibacteriota bacterium]